MPKFFLPLLFSLFAFVSFGQNTRQVIQDCAYSSVIKPDGDTTYLTLCSATDKNSIQLSIHGTLSNQDLFRLFDGDNVFATELPGAQKVGNQATTFTSSRLCLTVLARLQTVDAYLEIAGNCVPIDRSKWPVYQSKGKDN